jgi:hypothetical protein
MDQKNKMTRRQAVAGIDTTIAAVALVPSVVAGTSSQSGGPAKLEDPTKKYPKPPFKYQPQPWPGLQSKMDPVPDFPGVTCSCGNNFLLRQNQISISKWQRMECYQMKIRLRQLFQFLPNPCPGRLIV